jgi:dTDP-4-dehydrorhamnose 3,5-epimerase
MVRMPLLISRLGKHCMTIDETSLPGVRLLTPRVFRDERGLFLECWREDTFRSLGIDASFVQVNFSSSRRGTLRGLHYQIERAQGKLVQVTYGRVFDVAVDLRRSSPTFGKHFAIELDDQSHRMVYIPPGFAHGFQALSERADVTYRCTSYYAPEHERTLLWNDPAVGVAWPEIGALLLSPKDRKGQCLSDADCYP